MSTTVVDTKRWPVLRKAELGRFLLHFLEMNLVMQAGMGILAILLIPNWIPPQYEALRDHTSDLHGLAMTVSMIVPMVIWMRIRGHRWLMGFEMAAAMILPWAAVVLLCRAGLEDYVPWMRGLASPAMTLGMLGVMLYRRDHYTGKHQTPGPQSSVADTLTAAHEAQGSSRTRHRSQVVWAALWASIAAAALAVGSALLWRNGQPTTTPVQPVAAAARGVEVHLAATPPHLMAGQQTNLQYHLVDQQTGAPITDLVIDDERIMHALLISTDFADFQHVHPSAVGPGMYEVGFTPAVDTQYIAYSTFRHGRDELQATRYLMDHSGQILPPALAVDLAPKKVNGVRVGLLPPERIRVNEAALFNIRVDDLGSGAGVRNLEPFLGSPAQIAIVSGDGQQVMRTHAQASAPRTGANTATLPSGPELGFDQKFDASGLYRIWIQVQRAGQVLTAAFTIEVVS